LQGNGASSGAGAFMQSPQYQKTDAFNQRKVLKLVLTL
jgi:hypothetical protein